MVATLRCSNARKSTQEPTCMGPRNTASTLDKALACKYKFLWVHVRREQEPYHYFEHPGHVAGSFFIFLPSRIYLVLKPQSYLGKKSLCNMPWVLKVVVWLLFPPHMNP